MADVLGAKVESAMSLRMRLVVSIAVALLVSIAVVSSLAWWRAVRSVRTELQAAIEVSEQSVRNGIEDFAHSPDPFREPARLVATFDGDRHVVAALIGRDSGVIVTSQLLPPDRYIPAWFVSLVAPVTEAVKVPIPATAGGGELVLRADPLNETGEAWAALRDSVIELFVFFILAGGLMLATTRRALAPLARLTAALDRVGPGNYGMRIQASGSPDLAKLAEGFNHMSERLAAAEIQNRRLNQQLLTLQDEERADLARDLHDEVGPFLFSINVSAASIERLIATGDTVSAPAQLRLIRQDVGHVQKHVRAILERLRPISPTAFGLHGAIQGIAAFWRLRRPEISIRLSLGSLPENVTEAVLETAYRVVQEGVSNSVRHGAPRTIDVLLEPEADGVRIVVADDGNSAGSLGRFGFGLEGMRERVTALNGAFSAGPRTCGGSGWVVRASLPVNYAEAGPVAAAT